MNCAWFTFLQKESAESSQTSSLSSTDTTSQNASTLGMSTTSSTNTTSTLENSVTDDAQPQTKVKKFPFFRYAVIALFLFLFVN